MLEDKATKNLGASSLSSYENCRVFVPVAELSSCIYSIITIFSFIISKLGKLLFSSY